MNPGSEVINLENLHNDQRVHYENRGLGARAGSVLLIHVARAECYSTRSLSPREPWFLWFL